jgi:dehydrogenase/reductase SDR family member 12
VTPSARAAAAAVADAALEVSVVGSFFRIGLAARGHLLPEFTVGDPSARGQLAVVTGATSGLGLATATGLARRGMSVHFLAATRRRPSRPSS